MPNRLNRPSIRPPYLDEQLRRRVEQVTPRDVAGFVGWLCDTTEQGRRIALERREAKAKKDGVAAATLPLEAKPVHLADATVRRLLSPLRACMASAVAEGVVRTNPTIGAALPARDEQRAIDAGTDEDVTEVKALSTAELKAFMLACPERWRTFFRLLAVTGVRVSEAFALRWRDLELDGAKPHVRVRRAYVRGRFGPPKSKYSKRSIPIAHDPVLELRARRKASEWPGDDDLVFPATNGEPFAPREPTPTRAQANRRGGGCSLDRLPHLPAHLCDPALRRKPQRRASAALASTPPPSPSASM